MRMPTYNKKVSQALAYTEKKDAFVFGQLRNCDTNEEIYYVMKRAGYKYTTTTEQGWYKPANQA